MSELAPSPSQHGCPPHGLVSLWDMITIQAAQFIAAMKSLENARVVFAGLEKTMSLPDPKDIAERKRLEGKYAKNSKYFISLREFSELAQLMGARNTALYALEIAEELSPLKTFEWAMDALNQLSESLRRDLSSTPLFLLEIGDADYYTSPPKIVLDALKGNFRESEFDFIEAGKCLALDRSTACVMHLMRALEAPLLQLANLIGVKASPAAWGTTLQSIRERVDQMEKGKDGISWTSPELKREYHEAAKQFRHFKIRDRDPVVHDPCVKYTKEEARLVYIAVASFMSSVSKMVDFSAASPKSS